MASTRTQIYLTKDQRKRLDVLVRHSGRSLAAVVRDAVEHYLSAVGPDPRHALDETFGAAPDLVVPDRSEWDRG